MSRARLAGCAILGIMTALAGSGCAANRPVEPRTSAGAPGTGRRAGGGQAGSSAVPQAMPTAIGDRIVVPAIDRRGGELLVAYRHAGHAYLDVHGYDTVVLRFGSWPGGRLRSVGIYRRTMGGESLAKRYLFVRGGEDIEIVSDMGEDKGSVCKLSDQGGTLTARPEGMRFSYARGEAGALRFERETMLGLVVGQWTASGGGQVEMSRDGAPFAMGRYEKPSAQEDRYVERFLDDPAGARDVSVAIISKGEETRIRTDGIEPLNECLVVGLESFLPKEFFLENAALIDLSLGFATGFADNPGLKPLIARRSFSLGG